MKSYPFRSAVLYFILGCAWIFVSDWLLSAVDKETINKFQSIKGILFVFVTAVLLYFIILSSYKRLKKSQLDYRSLFKENPHPMLVYELESLRILTANNAFFERFQYAETDLNALLLTDIGMPEDKMAIVDFVKKVENKEYSDSGVWKQMTRNGGEFYARVSSHSTAFENKRARMMVIIDINEQIKAKRAIQTSERKLQALIDSTDDLVFMVDKNLSVVTANESFKQKLSVHPNVHIGFTTPFHLDALPQTEWIGKWVSRLQGAFENNHILVEEKLWNRAKNSFEYYEVVCNPIPDINSEVIGIACFARNITDQRKYEDKINRQIQQFKEITWMQSHELRRPLANIMGLSSLLNAEPANEALIHDTLPLLQKSCEELDTIVKNIVAKSSEIKE
ncbi:MAG: PAS domain S-box protein [Filimonas sp.]|nr:PAS domain S-box protein [Filimonas sp.]